MINKISIENFKSVIKDNIDCRNLNLFTGLNGSGKSTFIQSLLLLRQSFNIGSLNRKPECISLNSIEGLVNLGTYKDVLCQQAAKGDEKIDFEISFESQILKFTSEEYTSSNRNLNSIDGKLTDRITKYENESLFTNKFQYLAAERIQPEEDYPRFQSNELLGKRGEYTAHFIEKNGTKDINIKELSLKREPVSFTLINQVNDWMGEISSDIEVITKENLNTNKIELSYRYKQQDGTPSQDQKPQNVGFGITHTLPIVVALLSSQKGDVIIIENPETHLHPRGQSRLSELFALAAENGVQLFIETHSDHIINGLRVAVKKKKISNNNLLISYFSKSPTLITEIKKIPVDEDGGIDEWPSNFFDQSTKDLNYLLGI